MIKISLLAGVFCLSQVCAEEVNVDVKTETVLLKSFSVKVSESEGKAITEIVTTLGTNSIISLGFKKSHLKSLGKQLHGIGCLHFLGYIFSKDELKGYMKAVQNSSFKWSGFMDGLKPGFERESKSGQLLEDLPGFAALTGADYNKLSEEAKKQDWDKFVAVLVN